MKMKRAIITGGAGFIGSSLAMAIQRLYPEVPVTVIDSFVDPDSWKNLVGFKGDVIAHDLSSSGLLELPWLELDVDGTVVFHQAAISRTTEDDTFKMLRHNVQPLKELLLLCRGAGAKLIYASSSAVYGNHPRAPMIVGRNEVPLNAYGFSKLIGDQFVRMNLEGKPKDTNVVGLRYFNVYGPNEGHKGGSGSKIYQTWKELRDKRDATNASVRLFENTVHSVRDWIHVDDVVKANLMAVDADPGIYNIGSGVGIMFADLVRHVGEALGMNAELKFTFISNERKWCYQHYTLADLEETKAAMKDFDPMPPSVGIKKLVEFLEQEHAKGKETSF